MRTTVVGTLTFPQTFLRDDFEAVFPIYLPFIQV
jgi:hypothetical protein